MGFQRGIVHLSGQYDDTRLSIDGKKGISCLSVPISKERIKTDPDFEGTRRVNAEFKGASLLTDAMQLALGGTCVRFGDRYLRSRLMTIATSIGKNGSGDFGRRSVDVVPNGYLLKRQDLNLGERLQPRFSAQQDVSVNVDRNEATLDVPSFDLLAGMRVPQGATDFRVLLCAGVLSDHYYVGGTEYYTPVDADLNGLYGLTYSGYMSTQGQNAGFQLIATVPGVGVLPATCGLMVSVGIEFYKFVNGNPNLKAEGNAMRIQGIY